MKGKKQLLATLLFRTGVLRALKSVLRDRIVVLNYHRIRLDDQDFHTSFDDGVYGSTLAQFEEQVLWLKQHMRILSEAEMIECLHAGRGPGEMSVVVTIDDGHIDNYTRAYPVLRKHGVPAIFFIASGLIESRRVGWWDQLAYILKRTAKRQIEYNGRALDLGQRRQDAFIHLSQMVVDSMSNPTRNPLDELAQICEVEPANEQEQDAELMTWEQLKEVRANQIAVGSHAHSHLVMSRLSPERQREELTRSRSLIGDRIGCTVRSIAYPHGGRTDFGQETQRIARESGYEVGFSFYSGYNRWPTMSPFDIRRTEVPYYDRIGAAAAVILPELFTWPIGDTE